MFTVSYGPYVPEHTDRVLMSGFITWAWLLIPNVMFIWSVLKTLWQWNRWGCLLSCKSSQDTHAHMHTRTSTHTYVHVGSLLFLLSSVGHVSTFEAVWLCLAKQSDCALQGSQPGLTTTDGQHDTHIQSAGRTHAAAATPAQSFSSIFDGFTFLRVQLRLCVLGVCIICNGVCVLTVAVLTGHSDTWLIFYSIYWYLYFLVQMLDLPVWNGKQSSNKVELGQL